MRKSLGRAPKLFLALLLITSLTLGACQGGEITIDIDGDGGGGGSDSGQTGLSNQTMFIVLIGLMFAMFALVLVAATRR
jgi:LPXTG-motif cell wall-anchored protein